MQRIIISMFGAGLVVLALVATVVAAEPTPTPTAQTQVRTQDMIPGILDLTHEQVMALRQDGLSLAQIAERQDVDPQILIDALAARWAERIEFRVANGALTEEQAATLRTQLQTQARDMVYKTTLGGMQGAAVGGGMGRGAGMGAGMGAGRSAGPGAGQGAGPAAGAGICDGTGPRRAGQQ